MAKQDYKNDNEADERLDPYSKNASDLYKQEHDAVEGYNRAGDGLDDHPISGGVANGKEGDLSGGASKNVDKVKELETNSPNWTTNVGGGKAKETFSLKALFKKKGPIGIIIALCGVGGASFFTIPSILPLQLRAVAENFYGNVSRSSLYHYKSTIRYKIGNQKACSSPASIRCKMATVNDKTIDRYEKQGFKIESDKVGDRHVIKSATFPDGTKVTDGDAFVAHMDASTSARSKVFGVFNPRSGPYVGKNFTEKVLKKFGLAKNKIVLSNKDKAAAARSFNREAGVPEDAAANADENRTRTESEIKEKSLKVAGKVTNVVGLACGAYDLTRVGLGLVKAKNAVKYIAFGWFFLKAADQIRTGDMDAGTMTVIGGILTKVAASGENAGKSATDSPGYRAMANGDRGKLATSMQNILLGGNPALKKLDDTVIYIKSLFGTKSTHAGCKATSDPAIGAALSAAMCGASGAAAGTIVPVLGNTVGGVGGVAVCAAINLGLAIAGSLVVGKIIEEIMPALVDYLSSVRLDYDMSSMDTGNAITIGAGLLFATAGTSAGMKLATKKEASSFSKVAYEADKQYDDVARYDARDTPFDVENQYSFMGQIVSKFGVGATGGNPIAATLSSIGSIFSNAQTSLFSTVASAADMPSSLNDKTLGECYDPELAEKNIACDVVGIPQTVQTKAEMTQPEGENLDYMISNGYVADDGTVNTDKDYAKYLEYCTSKGEEVPGTSLLSISDDDYDWPDTRCQEQSTEISNFRTYTSRISGNEDEDTQYEDGATATDAAAVSQAGAVDGDDYAKEVRSVLGRAGTGQCVDFVLFRLVKHKVLDGPIALGNGKDVVGTLGRMGYTVNTTPAVHSVMSTSHTSQPQYGHTAMVSQVNSDGSIVVEEYNYADPLHYGSRTISAADIKSKEMTFAHTEVDYK
jgi:surface antigen